MSKVEHLIIAENEFNKIIAFMGTENNRLEMLLSLIHISMTTAPMEAKKAAILMSIRQKLRLEREKCQCSVL